MTKQNTLRIALLVLALAAAAVALITCSNNAPAPSPTIAPTEAPTETATVPATAPAAPADNAAVAETAVSSSTDSGTYSGTDAGTGSDTESTSVPTTFTIDQSVSEARFLINESLLGVPTEVRGVTNQITGTVAIDVANPMNTVVSSITIDARDLRTDRDLRNRAIRRFILESGKDEFRYITFTPVTIEGLPAQSAAPGESYAFQVTGDLQIKDVVQPVTFDVELTADSETKVTGTAKATILRSDFNLAIPSAPGVADVTDEVRLELAFTATAE